MQYTQAEKILLENVNKIGAYAISKLNELKDQNDVIEEIRGEGLLIGIKLNNEKMTAREFAEKALENKFLVVPAGDNVVRYFPPLNVTKEEIDISIEKIKKVLK